MLELDVQLTADGELVVFHDWDLRRLAGDPLVVEESPAAVLIGRPLRDPRTGFAGRLPSLREALAALAPEVPLDLEIKRRRAEPGRLAAAVVSAIAGRERTLVSSFDPEVLALLKASTPDRPVAPVADRRAREVLAAASRLNAVAVHVHRHLAGRGLVDRAGRLGLPVLAYTVNGALGARLLISRGVMGLVTDCPGRLRRRLEEQRRPTRGGDRARN